jgi:hypothetical protein
MFSKTCNGSLRQMPSIAFLNSIIVPARIGLRFAANLNAGMVDVNLLLTQLLAKGLIGKGTSADPVPSPVLSTAATLPDIADQLQKQTPAAETPKSEVQNQQPRSSSKVTVFEVCSHKHFCLPVIYNSFDCSVH